MSEAPSWKKRLEGQVPEDLGREIDIFETEIELRRQGKIEEALFAETRLRRGVYGQRYDNGHALRRPEDPDAGVPGGEHQGPQHPLARAGHAAHQDPLRRPDDPADGGPRRASPRSTPTPSSTSRRGRTCSCTTSTSTTPIDLMRRLAAVGITTREACGNSVRNVTACPLAGVCRTETFDVTPYSRALARFLLGPPRRAGLRPQGQDRFQRLRATRPAGWSTCTTSGWHRRDAHRRRRDAARLRSSTSAAASGRVPHQAKLFDEFVSEEELLPLCQAIGRVFARLGEKRNRARARLKFLVARLGIDEFRRLVLEEREGLPHDDRWTSYLDHLDETDEEPPASRPFPERGRICPRGSRTGTAPTSTPSASRGHGGGHRPSAPGGPDLRAVAGSGRHLPALRPGDRPHHGGAEHRPALGERGRAARPLRGAEGDRPRRLGGGHHRRRHRLPGHRHLQAGDRLLPGPGRRAAACASASVSTASTRPSRACASRSAAASTPAASTTWPTSASTGSAGKVNGLTVPHFQVILGRPLGRECRFLRSGHGGGPLQEHPPRPRPADRALRRKTARAASPSRSSWAAWASATSSRCSTTWCACPRTRRTPPSTRTGATPGSSPSTTWARASAPARSCPWPTSS